jgi:hypothetical protein
MAASGGLSLAAVICCDVTGNIPHMRLGCRYYFRLERSKDRDDLLPKRGHRSAAAANSTDVCGDDRLIKALVQAIDQKPCAPITHIHFARSLRHRAGARDCFEQRDLAEPDGTSAVEVDAKPNA